MAQDKQDLPIIEPTAIVDSRAVIGKRTKVWAFCQVAEYARIGDDCVLGNGVYIDRYVLIGNRVRIHNKALLYNGLIVEDDVFIGPGVCFTNDPWPKSENTRNLENINWKVRQGASIGANVTVLPDVTIGAYAVIGAGALVTKDIPDYGLAYGNPAKIHGFVCPCRGIIRNESRINPLNVICHTCGKILANSSDSEQFNS